MSLTARPRGSTFLPSATRANPTPRTGPAGSRCYRTWQKSPQRFAVLTESADTSVSVVTKQAARVEDVRILQRNKVFGVEFLVLLEDSTKVWLSGEYIADDLKTQYDANWWSACRQGEDVALEGILQHSCGTLLYSRDAKQRSPIHFLAGVGNTVTLKELLKERADVNAQDSDGYTAAHLAAGYMHLDALRCLLEAGADAELEDRTGRSVQGLLRTLLANMPVTTATYSRRVSLESILSTIESHIYEEVFPDRILSMRESNSGREYLVRWIDGYEDMWVTEMDISDDVISAFERNVENVVGKEVLTVGDGRTAGKQGKLIQVRKMRLRNRTGIN